eukprot:SAG11_NODE_8506_length_1008_cov_1.026403_2_plen_31_part_01
MGRNNKVSTCAKAGPLPKGGGWWWGGGRHDV